MFKAIFLFELKHWFKQPAIYIYTAFFSGVGFLIAADGANLFDEHEAVGKVAKFINSPYELNYVFGYISPFLLFLLPAIVGASIYKDFKSEMYKLLYSFPLRKSTYLSAKYLSASLIVLGITAIMLLSYMLVEFLAGSDPAHIGPFNIQGYLQLLLVYFLPNLMFFGAIVFAVVALSRNHYVGFGLVLILLIIQSTVKKVIEDPEWFARIDLLAKNTATYITLGWTFADRQSKLIPITEELIFNRLFWLSWATVALFILWRWFSLREQGLQFVLRKRGQLSEVAKKTTDSLRLKIPQVALRFDFKQMLVNVWYFSQYHLKSIVKSPLFLILYIMAICSMFMMVWQVTHNMQVTVLPTTAIIMRIPVMFYKLISILITFIYCGVLIHQERLHQTEQLVDSTAQKSWVFYLSKFLAIIKMQLILLAGMMICGISVQSISGFYDFNLAVYLIHLLGLFWIELIIWAAAAFLFQLFIPNLYIAIFMLIAFWAGSGNLNLLGIDSLLAAYNKIENVFYSDMNGLGHLIESFLLLESYWGCLAAIFLIATYLLWVRGVSQSWQDRWIKFRQRFNYRIGLALLVFLVGFISLGLKIHQEELNNAQYETAYQNLLLKEFEEKYKNLSHLPQPKIKAIDLELDIFPSEKRFSALGTYTLINQSSSKIDTLMIRSGFDEESTIALNLPYQLIEYKEALQFYLLKLDQTLEVGDSLSLNFSVKSKENSVFSRNSNVLENGTYLKQDVLPRIGYFPFIKKQQVDSTVRNTHLYADDAHRIDFKAIVSTDEGQQLVGPGKLIKHWEEEGRVYHQLEFEDPAKFSLGFISAHYDLMEESYKGVDFQIYHHPQHDYNLMAMMNGMKAALDYNQQYFGPYQHQSMRIAEFPLSEGTHATTYANNIAMSEMRFIANSDTSDGKIDQSFYIPVHEMTHQWWGNQLMPADAVGARLISESITEYISLQIYRKHYGEKQALNFLKQQHRRYFRAKRWNKNEQALKDVEQDKEHLFYGKGSMVFNAIAHYWGEAKMNAFLNSFLETYRFQSVPYPTSQDFIDSLHKVIPEDLKYLVEDGLEKVVLYETSIESASVKENKLSIMINLNKEFNNNTTALTLHDWVEIAFYQEDRLVELKKVMIKEEKTKLSFKIDQPIDRVVLDPNYLLVEEEKEDNVYELRAETAIR